MWSLEELKSQHLFRNHHHKMCHFDCNKSQKNCEILEGLINWYRMPHIWVILPDDVYFLCPSRPLWNIPIQKSQVGMRTLQTCTMNWSTHLPQTRCSTWSTITSLAFLNSSVRGTWRSRNYRRGQWKKFSCTPVFSGFGVHFAWFDTKSRQHCLFNENFLVQGTKWRKLSFW